MKLDRVIAVRNSKTVYRDGENCYKVFDADYSKADVLNEALAATRADMAPGETKQFYNKYIKPMHIEVDEDGEVFLRLGTK